MRMVEIIKTHHFGYLPKDIRKYVQPQIKSFYYCLDVTSESRTYNRNGIYGSRIMTHNFIQSLLHRASEIV